MQAAVLCEKGGLGSVKYLMEKVTAEFVGENELSLRPEFIYKVVPGIEISCDGKKLAAGGLVRPEVLRKAGIDTDKNTVLVVNFIVDYYKSL